MSAVPVTRKDPLDITAMYRAHAPFVGRVIRRLTGDGPHVDDLLQETFIVAFRQRDRFLGMAQVQTWLYRIAANLSMRQNRGKRRFASFLERWVGAAHSEPVASPSDTFERTQARLYVQGLLNALPFRQREVVVLYELEGLSGPDIAEKLGVPEGTVWTRLHHARKALAKLSARKTRGEQ